MKNEITLILVVFSMSYSQAQDVFTSEVPSVILNNFNLKYPKAKDVEWEKKGTNYQVEFELGWNKDHEIWYTPTGKIVKHKEDISKNKLPDKVQNVIKTNFKNYRVHDVERTSSHGSVVYKLYLNSLLNTDWDLVLDESGKILSKTRD